MCGDLFWFADAQQPSKIEDFNGDWLIHDFMGNSQTQKDKKLWSCLPSKAHPRLLEKMFKDFDVGWLQDGAPKIAKLPYKWFNYGLL